MWAVSGPNAKTLAPLASASARSLAVASQATRYQRRPWLTSEWGSTAAVDAIAVLTSEAKTLRVAAGSGDHAEVLWVDARAGDGERERRRGQRAHAAAQVRGEDLFELDEGSHGAFLDGGYGGAGCASKAHRDRDCLIVIEKQRRHRASGA